MTRIAHLSSTLLCAAALTGFAAQPWADTAAPHRAHAHASTVRNSNVVYVPTYYPNYYPSAYANYPRTSLALNRPQGRTLIGVPPLVDPAAAIIDRKAWSWRPMRLGIAPGFPAYASDIRTIDTPAVALDGATFVVDDVAYRLRGIEPPPHGTPAAEAARLRLEDLLATGERIVVYPVGLDYEQRMLTDAVLGTSDLAALLRGR